jgi:hypothetical protein
VRSLRWHYDDDGCLVIRATLPPEQGALVIEALQAAMDRLAEEGGDPNEEVEVEPACAHATCQGTDEAAAETAHEPVRESACNEPEDVSPETQDRQSSFQNSSSNPNPNLSPNLSPDAGSIPHLDPDLDPEQNPTLSQRRADALVFLSESWFTGNASGRGSSDAYLVNVHIDSATLAHAVAGRSELAEGPGLAAETVRRLCCDGGLVTHLTDAAGATIDVGRKTRAIPPAIRRALRHRDRCCRFPGCTRSRWLDGHHVVHWADGGETSLDNLVLLCRHHHRLVHEGGSARIPTPAAVSVSRRPPAR